jgi:release factor glutamine methyltransferase
MGGIQGMVLVAMTVFDLQKKYHDIPASDMDLLLAATIKKGKEFVYSHPEYPISIIQYLHFRRFIHRYKKGYSVAAITRHKEFYGLDFFVNKNVLIPRPDTELMVAEATKEITNSKLQIPNKFQNPKSKITLIDVGTGSGCIPISIACHAEFISASQKIPKQVRDDMLIFATDISRSALRVAKKNAKKHKVKINFLRGNLLEPILKTPSSILPLIGGGTESVLTIISPSTTRGGARGGVVITANLPYLTEKQFQSEPSIQREPKKALVAKNNGLALYEELLAQIKSLFIIHNSSFLILFEIDPSQIEAITKLITKYLPESKIEIKKDLGGLYRIVKITN